LQIVDAQYEHRLFVPISTAGKGDNAMSRSETAPFWEHGNFAPVREEITAFDLPVEGSIPPELRGPYARNGCNPREGHSGHWFTGDGMVRGVSLRDGRAEWYRNR
jgi:carotenoid cleavage dioxygenase-like enzyme